MPTVDYDTILNNLAVSGYGQSKQWSKTCSFSPTANAAFTLWAQDGISTIGVYTGAANTAVQVTSSTTGALSFVNAGAVTRDLFATWAEAFAITASATGTLVCLDRLLYYPGINHATIGATALTNGVALPRYTTGRGVMAFLEVTTGLNAVAHTVQLTYTDEAGVAGNTTTAITPIASSAANRIPLTNLFFPLAAGDVGVRSVQTVTVASGGAPTGTSALVLAYPLFSISLPSVGVKGTIDLLRERIALPQLYDNHSLMFIYIANAGPTTPTFSGSIDAVELTVS